MHLRPPFFSFPDINYLAWSDPNCPIDADYGRESSKEGADLIISNAETFIKKSEELLSTDNRWPPTAVDR